MVQAEAVERIYHHGNKPLAGSPVGQVVGLMNEVRPTAAVMEDLMTDCMRTLQRMGHLGAGA